MELLTDKVIYHVETQEDYDDLMGKLEELGCVLCNLNYFSDYGENTAIRVGNKKIFYSPLSFYLDNRNIVYKDYQIIKHKKEKNSMKVKLKADQRFIADWYEKHKINFDNHLFLLIGFYLNEEVHNDYDVLYSWIADTDDCIQTLVKMHLFGYEIEKEPLYYVELPNPNYESKVKKYYLARTADSRVVIQSGNTAEIKDNWKLTENEIKKDFAWAWDFAKEV